MRILLLNRSYIPIKLISRNNAIKLLYKGKAEAIRDDMEVITFSGVDFRDFPKVIRLFNYSGIPNSTKLSKRNIFRRDNYICAYCGNTFHPKDLTVDHIVPKSKGGKFTWQNLITSCFKDNNKKGNRTPDEARMKLLFQPSKPSGLNVLRDTVEFGQYHYPIWEQFFKK